MINLDQAVNQKVYARKGDASILTVAVGEGFTNTLKIELYHFNGAKFKTLEKNFTVDGSNANVDLTADLLKLHVRTYYYTIRDTTLGVTIFNGEFYVMNYPTNINESQSFTYPALQASEFYSGTFDITTSPIVLDYHNTKKVTLSGSADIVSNKVLNITNSFANRESTILFTIGLNTLEFPIICRFPSWQLGWDGASRILDFTQIGAGDYGIKMTWNIAESYYQCQLSGPF